MDNISVIIRNRNEERYIGYAIQSVLDTFDKPEIIVVDNNSTDNTTKIAKKFNIKITKLKNFKPGLAINYGIKKSKGSVIVCLSGHCIPVDKDWLINLIKNLNNKNVAGVYGRQEPLSFSSDLDKRDLFYTFGFHLLTTKSQENHLLKSVSGKRKVVGLERYVRSS